MVIGILAHVDAGKTTLSEGLLYASGMIRSRGRVDRRDAHLDTDALERERGITIFSKQAILALPGCAAVLLDTPGHTDFCAEMERTLWVLDYAILVISGADGIQGHTRTLWRLLGEYGIPVFLFVNKMDQPGADAERLMADLKRQLSDGCIRVPQLSDAGQAEKFLEEAALCSEEALDAYLGEGSLSDAQIGRMIVKRQLFLCFFGSALKYEGVEELLRGICDYAVKKEYPKEFGARVFKVARDASGTRLTHLKVTGGSLKVRDVVHDADGQWEEKASQLRIYSGEKYETAAEASAGEICAVAGLSKTRPGEGLGMEETFAASFFEPVLTYRVLLPDGCDAMQMLPNLRQFEEEDPKLAFSWNEAHREISVRVMGQVQTQVLKRRVLDRFGVEIDFGAGRIFYKETIADTVEGVGHFEPLCHYAEVHLILSPLAPGSGVVFETACGEDVLERSLQRQILAHLREKEHCGVLTGSPVTDMKITLAAAKAHLKHTEGGDFRQAACRAVRQGLMQAKSVLLEPYYQYRIEVPEDKIGRAMTDLKLRQAVMEEPVRHDGTAVLTGRAPAALLWDYAKEIAAYAKGSGGISLSYGGYDICRNAEEAIAQIGYHADADMENPSSSIFCMHGAGHSVEWDRVPEFMHLASVLPKQAKEDTGGSLPAARESGGEKWIGTQEVDAILERASGANRKKKPAGGAVWARHIAAEAKEKEEEAVQRKCHSKEEDREEVFLVDGYNMIHAWEELRTLASQNMDGARGRLLDLLCNYQGMKQCRLIVVFDAYRTKGHETEDFSYHNIRVVYTKEAETADAYIEKFAYENGKKYRITVATSDGMEQLIIRGAGCLVMSAQQLWMELERMRETWV